MDDNFSLFFQYVNDITARVEELYQQVNQEKSLSSQLLLPMAMNELVTEGLNLVVEELRQQQEELIFTRMAAETERQRYQELFEFSPDAYIVTDSLGIIQKANHTAISLLNLPLSSLIGKPLSNFVSLTDRQRFRSQINQIFCQDQLQELVIDIYPYQRESFKAALNFAIVGNPEGTLVNLLICIRDIGKLMQILNQQETDKHNIETNQIKHPYCKGDLIPVDSKYLYLVCDGLVKVSTFTEEGDEVIIGFVGSQMLFGSCLTSLQVYQARAISKDVSVIAIPFDKALALPNIAQYLFPKMIRVFKQSQAFLTVSAYRHIQERLYNMLLLLKEEFGQTVAHGTCINIRLTHSDLASICCTTRVTVTRIMNKLQSQGKITFDQKKHIILVASK